MAKSVISALKEALPEGTVLSDPDVMEPYRYDRAMTVQPGRPVAVVRATSTRDVQSTLTIASRLGIPVVTRGAGTGISGGAAAVEGCITLSTEKMREIEIDPAAMLARVQPGLFNAEVKAAAREHGLWYPPDPSSFEICSIGGNLGTNAGGLCCLRYGVTTDYVLGLEVVLADGRVLRLGGRTVKDVVGYDLMRLFVGSEGSLGVITEATLRLRPLPPPVSTVVATFGDIVSCGRAVTGTMSSVRPSVLELMDAAAIDAVQRVKPFGIEPGVGALLIGQCDAASEDSGKVAAACEHVGATYVAVTDDPEEGELLMGARRMAFPCIERLGTVMIEDVGVPVPLLPDLVAAIAAIAESTDTLVPVVGHAGDGNLHPLVVYAATDPAAVGRAGDAFDRIMRVAIELGGTISGEHGVGSLKAPYIAQQLSADVLDVTRAIKGVLDPLGILNPGKWV